MQSISLFRLFLIFLKIGTTAFGGNIALVAAVRKDLCERRKLLSDEQVLDFTTLGNILPGPLATNVIASCGYAIHGLAGAAAGLAGVILPALILICALAQFYFTHGNADWLLKIFGGLLPGVSAIIAATAWSLAKKHIKNALQVVILIAAAVVIFFLKGFLVTLIIVSVAGLIGFFFFRTKKEEAHEAIKIKISNAPLYTFLGMLACGLILFLLHPASLLLQELRMLSLTFGTMSVTLFGGGYVFIPAIAKVVVDMHHWVTAKEFADGIAMGQVTPGPVSITASFVGYRLAGIWGAIVSAITIFVPPAVLMLVAQQFMDRLKGRPEVDSIFKCVRPAVIGMILVSVWVIGKSAPQDWQSLAIFGTILLLSLWKNYDTAILVLVAGAMGWLLHLI
jgi:chromate transporter